MAADAVAVLDAAGVERAHVMGLSMGGMIVQHLAIHHRDRLLSMVSVMSRTGESDYGQSTPEALARLTAAAGHRPRVGGRQQQSRGCASGVARSSPTRTGGLQTLAERSTGRSTRPGSVGSTPRSSRRTPGPTDLPVVTTPTLVLHGTADTLIDISGGHRTAELIPGATFVAIEGMGHDYPPQLWQRWVDEIARFCLGPS